MWRRRVVAPLGKQRWETEEKGMKGGKGGGGGRGDKGGVVAVTGKPRPRRRVAQNLQMLFFRETALKSGETVRTTFHFPLGSNGSRKGGVRKNSRRCLLRCYVHSRFR